MQIESHYPLDLSIIPEPPPGQQPDHPIHKLLQLAIFGSPQHMLTAEEIYKAMEARFEWYRSNRSSGVRAARHFAVICSTHLLNLACQPKIRHTLSLYKIFQRVKRIGPNKGNYWTLDTSNGDGTYKKQRTEKVAKHAIEGATKQQNASLREDGDKRSKREVIVPNKLDNGSMRSPRPVGRRRRETFIRGSSNNTSVIEDKQEASSTSRQRCLVGNKIKENSHIISNNSPHVDAGATSRSRVPSWQSDIESFGTQRWPSLSLVSHNSPYSVEDSLPPVESFTKTVEASSLFTRCYVIFRGQSGTGSSFPTYYAPSIHMISPLDGVRLPPITGRKRYRSLSIIV
jgi:hypothetical protein